MTFATLMLKFDRIELQRLSSGAWHVSVERLGGKFSLDADVPSLEAAIEVVEALVGEET